MILHLLRALFILLMAAVGWSSVKQGKSLFGNENWFWVMAITLVVGVVFISIDILAPRRKLAVFSGTFLGLLIGLLMAFVFSLITPLVIDQLIPTMAEGRRNDLVNFVNLTVGVVCCYLAISFIIQTKDDFRFIIPYVEFSKQTKGQRPILVDTSILIDGRILDIAATGILEGRLIVPRFVLTELQAVADSADRLKRNRGRRGLDILNKLQGNRKVDVILYDSSMREEPQFSGVDEKLMALAKELGARVLTNDFNLSKVAQVREVDVINLNDLSNALRPVVLPGERMNVRLIKPGEEGNQGVGYMEDGTMVVVEQGRPHLNQEVEFVVTSVLQTSAGRMIFGRMGNDAPAGGPPRRSRSRSDSAPAA